VPKNREGSRVTQARPKPVDTDTLPLPEHPVSDRIVALFDTMPRQMQVAARYVLDHPEDVALLTMREQAKRANVPPATMTRLAQRLEFDGYDAIRLLYAQAVRQRPESYTRRAEELLARHRAEGEDAIVVETMGAIIQHLQHLSGPQAIKEMKVAAQRMAGARRIYCLGMRSSFPIAYIFHYLQQLLGASSVLVDAAGGVANDVIRSATSSDLFLAVSVKPYTKQTLDMVRYAHGRDVCIVAITDSVVSPLASLATHTVIVPTDTPSFFHTMAPAFAVMECLAAMTTTLRGTDAVEALSDSDAFLAETGVYVQSR